ncbi:cell division protein ZapA [Comamonas endophytica]|uniref:Cell division protein ZapA n=1 Tax=Comamonas endophytica TaxID=2949090 RepID=A0ABY6GAF6_9BURK|nr:MULTISPECIES: cell division protein ZapA [unclassified Acidovorax]MCD2513961.1 cell division protein ZapA [Acidovorax sp. D4N7]UYG51697.1 cell division protein ZapA [Acidovorax sp. 5MLIR]UYG52046.1 cell division protein ZapA [Acidovorax sp. 5MLIR]
MKQLDVQILHQNYLLTCPEGHEERLLEAVARVNDTMARIRDAGKVRSRERVAVLTALNMAFDIVTAERMPAPAPVVAEPVAVETTAAEDALVQAAMIQQQEDAQRIVALLERLDQALEDDPQLL